MIRVEAPRDRAPVRRVHLAAFAGPAEADLVDALREAGDCVPSLCLVADGAEGSEVVGHACLSRARLEPGGEPVLALAPMAVLPGRQRRGIGSALVREALRRAQGSGYAYVVVLGHPGYYPRFGFVPGESCGVAAPFAVPPEAWMVLPLTAQRPAGTVVYADAFGAVTSASPARVRE